MTSQIFKMCKQ